MTFFPEIILGPPGTGKTTTLLNIVEEELARGVPPDRIGFLSFTRKAANQAVDRAVAKFGLSSTQLPYFRTIHSLCFRLLGLRNSEIFEGNKLKEFGEWIGMRVTGRWTEDGLFNGWAEGDRIIHLDNLARVTGVSLLELYNSSSENIRWSEIDRVVRGLKVFKQENNLYDFTDILENYVERGHKPKLEILLCDESQDMSNLQWRVIEKLAVGARRVVVVGDDDQNIFGFAGSSVQRFIDQPGNVTVLGQSFRVPPIIQNLSLKIIEKVRNRRQKIWSPKPGVGLIEQRGSFDQVDVSGEDVLVLARNTYLLDNIVVPTLRRNGVIYERHGHSSVKDSVLHAIQDWETLRIGGTISIIAARNLYEFFTSGIGVARGHKKLPQFLDDDFVNADMLITKGGLLASPTKIWHEALDRLPANEKSYIIACRRRGEKISKPRVRLSTIHSIKGDEGEHVVLFRELAKKTHMEMKIDPDSEARVAYVGVTRTKSKLTLVDASNERSYEF